MNDLWVAGSRPVQSLQQFEEGDIVRVTTPGGRTAIYKVTGVDWDGQGGTQITMELKGSAEQWVNSAD